MHTYFLSGAAGFIASKVAELLLEDGHTVIGVDNLNDYYNPCLKRWRLKQLSFYKQFRFAEGDIENADFLSQTIVENNDVNAVIHLAARAGVRPSVQQPLQYANTNIVGTLNILELCRARKIPKLVIASSSSVYGAHNPIPFHEESDTSRPLSPYAASKKATEELCFTYHYLHGLDVSALRFFTVYGPSGRPDMSMFRFIRGIVEGKPLTVFGDGTQLRDFSYVEDIARGTIAALKPTGYRIFNLGANHPVKLSTIIECIERATSKKAIIESYPADPSDVPATWADISRAQAELGWEPSTSLEAGIGQAVKWYLDNRDWACSV